MNWYKITALYFALVNLNSELLHLKIILLPLMLKYHIFNHSFNIYEEYLKFLTQNEMISYH